MEVAEFLPSASAVAFLTIPGLGQSDVLVRVAVI